MSLPAASATQEPYRRQSGLQHDVAATAIAPAHLGAGASTIVESDWTTRHTAPGSGRLDHNS